MRWRNRYRRLTSGVITGGGVTSGGGVGFMVILSLWMPLWMALWMVVAPARPVAADVADVAETSLQIAARDDTRSDAAGVPAAADGTDATETNLEIAAREDARRKRIIESYNLHFGDDNGGHDELVLDIRSSRGIALAQNIVVKTRDGRVYFDLVALSDSLGGVLKWDGARATGWLRGEDDGTVIEADQLVHRGATRRLSPADAFIEDDMLFVEQGVVALLYGVDIRIEISRLRAVIDGPPTATERRILRDRARRSLAGRDIRRVNGGRHMGDVAAFSGYDDRALNNLRVTASSRFKRRGNSDGSNLDRSRIYSVGRFDLMRSRMKIVTNATDEDGLTDMRISSRGINPGDPVYTEFEAGDITSRRIVNGGGTAHGVGLRLSNHPLYRAEVVGEEVISGDAPPGWDVELHLDGSLIDMTTADERGRYEFPATPLRSGGNEFTIRIHGPEGQLRTIERDIYANHGVPPKGELRYAVSAQRDGTTLAGNYERHIRKGNPNWYRDRHRLRFTSEFNYAVTNQTAITGGLSQIPTAGDEARLTTIGVRSNIAGRLYTLDATRAGDAADGTALRAYSRLILGQASGSLTYRHYDGFTGEAAKYGSQFRRNKLDLFWNMPFRGLGADRQTSVTGSFRYGSSRIRDNRFIQTFAPRLAWSHRKVNMSASLHMERRTSADKRRSHKANARLSVSRHIGDRQLSGVISGTTQPDARVTQYVMRYRNRHSRKLTTEIKLRHEPNSGTLKKKETSLNWGATIKQSRYKLGAAANLDTRGRHAFSVTLTSQLSQTPDRSGSTWRHTERPDSGAVIGHAFIDHNGNKIWDAGDETLSDAVLTTRYASETITRTDDNMSLVTGLPVNRPISLGIDAGSTEYPLLTGLDERKHLILREGAVKRVSFPVRPAGEIEGAAFVQTTNPDGETVMTPLRNMPLEIVDRNDGTIHRARTQYDGQFIVSGIAFGDYSLRPAASYLHRRDLVLDSESSALMLSLKNGTEWVEGVKIVLTHADAQ